MTFAQLLDEANNPVPARRVPRSVERKERPVGLNYKRRPDVWKEAKALYEANAMTDRDLTVALNIDKNHAFFIRNKLLNEGFLQAFAERRAPKGKTVMAYISKAVALRMLKEAR